MAAEGVPPTPHLIIISGSRRVGKTRLCERLANEARAAGWTVGGLLSPPALSGVAKDGILATDLAGGETRRLAWLRPDRGVAPTRHYVFVEETLGWAAEVLNRVERVDLLVVDEIGPIELVAGGGLIGALDRLRVGDYRLGLVVVRPELIDLFGARLGWHPQVVVVSEENRDHLDLGAVNALARASSPRERPPK